MALFPTPAQAIAFDGLPAVRAFVRLDEEPWRAFERAFEGEYGAQGDGSMARLRQRPVLFATTIPMNAIREMGDGVLYLVPWRAARVLTSSRDTSPHSAAPLPPRWGGGSTLVGYRCFPRKSGGGTGLHRLPDAQPSDLTKLVVHVGTQCRIAVHGQRDRVRERHQQTPISTVGQQTKQETLNKEWLC